MKLGRKQGDDLLITSLACGATVEAAAHKAGMCERSVYRRLESKEFKQRLQDFRDDIVKRTSAVLTAASMEAVKTLVSLMERSTAPSARLGAARSVLEISMKLREVVELEDRIRALEKDAFESDDRS